MARAFAAAPIVGKNFVAGKFAQVRETFVRAAIIGGCIMALLTAVCQFSAAWTIGAFTREPTALAVGTKCLQAVLQGLGNIVPAVLGSASRIVSRVVPALCLATAPRF